MKRVGHEWQWTQKHSCGHTTYQAVYGGARPDAAAKRLRNAECPRCNLIDLLRNNYGDRAAEDIAEISAS